MKSGIQLFVTVVALSSAVEDGDWDRPQAMVDLLQKFQRLEEQVLRQQNIIEQQHVENQRLRQSVGALNGKVRRLEGVGLNSAGDPQQGARAILRTCEEIRSSDPSSESGMYFIDPDGQGGGDSPIYVYCDMSTGSTFVSHDTENLTQVSSCSEPGCYSRSVVYNSSMRQMVALSQLSSVCRQSVRFDCLGVPLQYDDVDYAWWNDRSGQLQHFWAGSFDADVHTCECGILSSCLDPSLYCNCDSVANFATFDQGYITKKDILPVTRLNFGRSADPSGYGRHTLGKFECSGRASIGQMPGSCQDLWQSGHSLSGFYSVKGTNSLRTVFCDFSKLPGDEGLEKEIGVSDVKSSPVYFHVQKNATFEEANSTIPFQVERLNVGKAMNLETGVFTAPIGGVYFFSFTGLSFNETATVHMYLNDAVTSSTFAPASSYALAVSTSLSLEAGDEVMMVLQAGNIYDGWMRYTNFVGLLLQEHLAFA